MKWNLMLQKEAIYMSEKRIEDMDFKELRKKVAELESTLAYMKRTYEDLFYNLDNDNFSSTILKEKENMKTQIDINAEGIKVVTEEVFPNGTENESQIDINAKAIATKVSAVFNEPISVDVSSSTDMNVYLEDADKDRLYYRTTDDTYWFWNEITEQWQKSTSNNIYSIFRQTKSGFLMKGDLETITQDNHKMTVSDSYIRMYGDTTGIPKVQLGFINYDSAEYPQLILGSGSVPHNAGGIGKDQFVIQKVVGGGNISYITENGRWNMLQFSDSGFDFSSCLGIKGLTTGAELNHNHGIPNGTRLATTDFTGNVTGFIEFTASGAHRHEVEVG